MAQTHALPSASCAPPLNPSGRRPLSFAPPREPAAPQEPVTARAVRKGRRERPLLLVLVVLAHAAGLAGLAQLARQPVAEAETPISVALIELPVPVPTVAPPPPRPVVEPPPKPAPRPQTRAPKSAPKVTEAPTAIRSETPPPQPTPDPAREAVTPPPPAPPARPAPEAPPVVIAARFDAAYLNNPAPAYPPLSRRMREEGKVMLRVQVTAEGLPAQVDLAESSGYARLDTAAREAVQRWRFVPAKQGGQPVAAAVIVPIVFKLEGN